MKVLTHIASRFFILTFFMSMISCNSIGLAQENEVQYKFGVEVNYTPSYNFVQQHKGTSISQTAFDTIKANEFGRIVQPITLNFTYDPIVQLRLKLGFGYQEFGSHSPRYISQLENNTFTEVSFQEVSRYIQVPISLQFFTVKSFYVEASYVPLFFVNSKSTQFYESDNFTDKTVQITNVGYNSYNQLIALSLGYQARLGESSVSVSLAPKICYSLGFVEQSSNQIQRSHWQVGINIGIHTFL